MPSANSQSDAPTRVLPSWVVFREACQFPWHHRWQVSRLLIIPLFLSTTLTILDLSLVDEMAPSFPLLTLAFSQLYLVPFTFFAVSYHRLILMGEHAISKYGVPAWTMRETRFLVWIIAIYVVSLIFVILVSVGLSILTFSIARIAGDTIVDRPAYLLMIGPVAIIPWVYYVGRMSLVLPAVAIDHRPTFNSAMSLSESNEWRVALLVGGVPIAWVGLFALIYWITDRLPEMNGEEIPSTLNSFSVVELGLQHLLHYVWLTIEVAILSITFRELSSSDGAASPSQTPT